VDKTLETALLKPQYSFKWSQGVFKQWFQKHARVGNLVLHIVGLSSKQAITMIATPQSSWWIVKDLTYKLEKMLQMGKTEVELQQAIYRFGKLHEKCYPKLLKSIDRYFEADYAYGAVSRVGFGTEATAEAPNPSFDLRSHSSDLELDSEEAWRLRDERSQMHFEFFELAAESRSAPRTAS